MHAGKKKFRYWDNYSYIHYPSLFTIRLILLLILHLKSSKGKLPFALQQRKGGCKNQFHFMRKKIKKTFIALALSLTLFCGIAYAIEQDDCSPNITFWGTRCCTYIIEDPVYVDEIVQKCCDFRVFINFGCEETSIFP